MPSLSPKKLLLLAFLLFTLIAIPITVYLVQQQQETRTRAEKATTLSLSPGTKTASVGATLDFDILVNPGGVNRVGFIKLVLKYDPTLLAAKDPAFVLNPASNLSILQGPTVREDEVSVVLSVQFDPTKVIQATTKVGTVSFEALGPTDSLPTQVSFDTAQTIVASSGSSDSPGENVLSTTQQATVTIEGEAAPTPTPEATPTPSLEPSPEASPTPAGSQPPVCESLSTDKSTEGAAPYTITFSATGNDSDGTISKVTFNYGDGVSEDVTTGAGIGGASIDIAKAHTYQTAGTYTASATLTDNTNAVSDVINCSATITITAGGAEVSGTPTPIPAVGPENTIIGVGAIGAVLFLIGALLFFAL